MADSRWRRRPAPEHGSPGVKTGSGRRQGARRDGRERLVRRRRERTVGTDGERCVGGCGGINGGGAPGRPAMMRALAVCIVWGVARGWAAAALAGRKGPTLPVEVRASCAAAAGFRIASGASVAVAEACLGGEEIGVLGAKQGPEKW